MRASHLPLVSLFGMFSIVLLVAGLGGLAGCSDDGNPAGPTFSSGDDDDASLAGLPGASEHETRDAAPPSGIVTVHFGDPSLDLWPYTGSSFDGEPSDPVNLIFVGQAEPLQIRAALMALDGDRTAFGFPDVDPFNGTWSEANGDVQTCWAGAEGWTANYVQLQCGHYDPARVHMRLFETNSPFGDGTWTVAAAHFEILIPGTADHQVLHWELAEQLVIADMVRTGLLDPSVPMMPSGLINDAPTFREIPAEIYNALPRDLQVLILGPGAPEQVAEPVGIPTDGQATILYLAAAAAVLPGSWSETVTEVYQQIVPKPFCNDGSQFVLVEGPVTFDKKAEVLPGGNYLCDASYSGELTITPWDVFENIPAGDPYPATVKGSHRGLRNEGGWHVTWDDSKVAKESEGKELRIVSLKLREGGPKQFRILTRCL
ncbi:MAG: hypothetical protein ACE15D_01050 [Candidatus Eisenbacteria bacterium]|nr:hypothetical protein [Candidatus Eisenbacteria bacterium]